MRRIPEIMTERARALRSNQTDAERVLWQQLRQYRPRFTRQLVIGSTILDFACRQAKLAIELDGGHHALQADKDEARSRVLGQAGWRVLRFWNSDVTDNVEGVVDMIMAAAAECLGGTHPQPLPCREGSRSINPRTTTRAFPPGA